MGRAVSSAAGVFFLLAAASACGTAPDLRPAPAEITDTGHQSTAVLALSCSGCHSPQGGAMTSLENRSAESLREALLVYWRDPKGTTVMHRMVRGYTEADITAISAYLAEQEPP